MESGPVFRNFNPEENVQEAALNPASVGWILKSGIGRASVRWDAEAVRRGHKILVNCATLSGTARCGRVRRLHGPQS